MNKYAEFRALFLEKFATNSCKELLGYDVSLPEQLEEALSSGRMLDLCPKVVESVIENVGGNIIDERCTYFIYEGADTRTDKDQADAFF